MIPKLIKNKKCLQGDMPVLSKGNVFDIASITKLVTATAIFILVSRGKLSLNDGVGEILKIKKF